MTLLQPSPLLRLTLKVDALAGGAMGLLMALAAQPLGELLGLPFVLLLVAGIVLLPLALVLYWMSNQPALSRTGVWAVIALNALWVVESAALLVTGYVQPTALGYAFVIGQALVVLLFAELEFFGLRRSAVLAL
ncbi:MULTISPECIES: hypothetical protein [Pseudomonas]|uniref:Uncharacterized protein n=1 Tax=Pseudomonas nitroreducens TaxID=46680 RepID=A0A6G6J4V0_PSENT|nr:MULTISPECIES: hypothetical protein [Pseudomonas]MBG6286254.1 hypothetical protein [Pseudomonas nitroreducens]MCJ1880711.1 hypothetical protein [Pseudomonas nitroreducens]MCJ1894027.1 hypothetical protein [Pseudomonas nitroreducens]MDG9856701.1 hypothetical protein [Pseudomonas nitroreducens]NMZ60883.1 hypothetical protein [Pseudomonas nitroreducens]